MLVGAVDVNILFLNFKCDDDDVRLASRFFSAMFWEKRVLTAFSSSPA